MRGEALHLTLKFWGEVQDERLAEIVTALKGATSTREIALRIRGIGTFPNPRHARVIWAGVEAGAELAALAAAIEARMALLGFAREERAYAPHVTLARMQSREPLPKLMSAAARFAQYDFGAMAAREFQLFRSTLKPSGAEYRVLEVLSWRPLPTLRILGEIYVSHSGDCVRARLDSLRADPGEADGWARHPRSGQRQYRRGERGAQRRKTGGRSDVAARRGKRLPGGVACGAFHRQQYFLDDDRGDVRGDRPHFSDLAEAARRQGSGRRGWESSCRSPGMRWRSR